MIPGSRKVRKNKRRKRRTAVETAFVLGVKIERQHKRCDVRKDPWEIVFPEHHTPLDWTRWRYRISTGLVSVQGQFGRMVSAAARALADKIDADVLAGMRYKL
jgi:hypothetical protein